MHEQIRVAEPDFADVRLGIIQFADMSKDGVRDVVLHTHSEAMPLFSMEELMEKTNAVLELWYQIQMERTAETRRKGTGTHGPLL